MGLEILTEEMALALGYAISKELKDYEGVQKQETVRYNTYRCLCEDWETLRLHFLDSFGKNITTEIAKIATTKQYKRS